MLITVVSFVLATNKYFRFGFKNSKNSIVICYFVIVLFFRPVPEWTIQMWAKTSNESDLMEMHPPVRRRRIRSFHQLCVSYFLFLFGFREDYHKMYFSKSLSLKKINLQFFQLQRSVPQDLHSFKLPLSWMDIDWNFPKTENPAIFHKFTSIASQSVHSAKQDPKMVKVKMRQSERRIWTDPAKWSKFSLEFLKCGSRES